MKWVLENWVWVVSLVAAGLFGYWYVCSRGRREEEEKKRINGVLPRGCLGWPFVGETLHFIASGYSSRPVSFMDKRKAKYGKVFKTHILGRPVIVSTDPQVNKSILLNHSNVFVPWYPKSVTELLGKSSILQMNGALQKRVHGLIGGFLRSPQLKEFITKYIENSVKLSLSSWKAKHGPIYLQDEVKKITFQVLVMVLMSVDPGEDMNFLKREFEEFIKGIICLPIKFPGTRLYRSLKAKDRLMKMVKRVVDERRSADKKSSPGDAIDVLLQDAGDSSETLQHLPSDFISENIVEMMIPGEDSVPMVITLAVKFLSDTPVALAHLVEENMELKRRKADSGEEYAWTDYTTLPFTQNVISETLRMANIINAVWRKALKDVQLDGYFIPKGWCVLASLTSVHMGEDNFEDPYHFDPWRWEKKGGSVNSSCFTPFGGGQRLCPGLELSRLEISIFLHHLLTTYRWVVEDDEIIYFPTVKMKRKLPIKIIGAVDH